MAAAAMATGSGAPWRISFFGCSHGKPAAAISPSRPASHPKTQKLYPSLSSNQLVLGSFAPWSGLKLLGISRQPKIRERNQKCQGRIVYASLFGVGAPEALVIGVVALLVFGPKGLAEVARNLGKTLRAFQPTIRELQEVSREFKSTLEREIGLEEVASSANNTYKPGSSLENEKPQAVLDPNGFPPTTQTYSSEELLKRAEEQLTQAQPTISKEQPEGAATSPKVVATNSSEGATQIPIAEKTENET